MIDHLEVELDAFDTALARSARHQSGCNALLRRYGIGWLTAVAIWAELGDVCRFTGSRQAVRFTGLDITSPSQTASAPAPPPPTTPTTSRVRQRLGGKRAALSVARKLAREADHTLRELGDQALVPAEFPTAA
jgi:Transposase IS116/IS110/IS902 family